MTTSLTRIKLKISNTEVDIECDIDNLPDIISQIPNIIQSISNISGSGSTEENIRISDNPIENQLSLPPEIVINKSDSLTDVLLKLFTSNWSNEPKKLIRTKRLKFLN